MVTGLSLGITASGFKVTAAAEVIRRKVNVVDGTGGTGAAISTTTSKFGGSSVRFDGDNDALIVPSSQGFDFSGDFTFEAWIYKDSTSGNEKIFDFRGINDATYSPFNEGSVALSSSLLIDINGDDFRVFIGGTNRNTNTNQLSAATWHHIAVCRTSGTISAYFDGTQQFTYSDSTDYSSVFDYAQPIGVAGTDGGFDWTGYMDEIRWSNTGRYTTGFTPSTTPFTNDDNTLLLLHCDGTNGSTFFEDDNGTRAKIGVTAVGDAQVDTAQSQFGGTSVALDGTGDYLTIDVPSFTSIGTGDFTIECWARGTTIQNEGIFHLSDDSDYIKASSSNSLAVAFFRSNPAYWQAYYNDGSSTSRGKTASICYTDTWYHIALVRSSSTIAFYIDGVQQWTDSDTKDYSSLRYLMLGGYYNTSYLLPGYIDEFRISDTARYTSGFTPSTTPFTNDTNTLLLLHMDGTDASTDFRDDNGKGRAQVGVSANGNAQIDTAQSKFGGASAYFDGTGDYLRGDLNYSFGSSQDLTWECWFRQDTNTNTYPLIFGNYTSYGANDWGLFVDRNNDNTIRLFAKNLGDELLTSTTSIADDTWYHVAVTRSGSNWTLWVNGTSEDTATNAGSVDTAGRDLYVAADPNTSTTFFHGWIDELRWSDTARYTTSFTPETTPFQNDANTLILLHMDGTDGSTTFIDDNGTYTE